MSKGFNDLIAKVNTCGMKKVAVAVAQDAHVLEAVKAAKERKIAEAILVGDQAKIEEVAASIQMDLSGYEIIHAKDTGVIPGFSDSLINFGDYLLGVGFNEFNETKLEVYREGNDTVESVCKYELMGTYPELEYKSFLIDRENGLFGFAYHEYGNRNQQFYVLLGFDGNSFTEIAKVPMLYS